MTKLKKHIALFVCMFILQVLVFPVKGFSATESEYRLKAAFIYNFAKFIEWSNEEIHKESFVIGILGNNPFGRDIDIIRGKKIKDSAIEIRQYSSIDEVNECSILFISSSEKQNIIFLINELKNKNTLTIGDTSGYAHKGIMINLYKANNKLRFEINNRAAESAGLKISSHLLKLGKIVEKEDSEADK